jgi:hypothetical protein
LPSIGDKNENTDEFFSPRAHHLSEKIELKQMIVICTWQIEHRNSSSKE